MSRRYSQEPETMANSSPYSGGDYYYDAKKFPSPSPTPSPRGPGYYYQPPPVRPATRAHFRGQSTSSFTNNNFPSPRGPSFSPRYTSNGEYATANVSQSRSSRKPSFSGSRPKHERRSSFSYYRASDHHGESDEDEFIEINGITYFVPPARSKSKRASREYYTINAGGHATDYHYYEQGGPYFDREAGGFAPPPRYEPERKPPPSLHTRRNSTSVPQRPQTARPASSHTPKKPAPETKRPATEADAKRHRIPQGYSLKNWDPNEEPITLLGSVFDANSLGKWIYDWTVFHHGPATPISDMAGDLWLLLIKLAGKIKGAEKLFDSKKQDISVGRKVDGKMKHDSQYDPGSSQKHSSSALHNILRKLGNLSWNEKLLVTALCISYLASPALAQGGNHAQEVTIHVLGFFSIGTAVAFLPLRATTHMYWILPIWGVAFTGMLMLELYRAKGSLQRRLLVGSVMFLVLTPLGSITDGSLEGVFAWAPFSLTATLLLVSAAIDYFGPRVVANAAIQAGV
ncbi:hypothetical protein QBC34DRAFT_67378 [Podospora aff. communis PSN243]|uniref:Uncharacterized protein n=1 Tax=Podospora aff. communis PSN243 TaxID=3040156 RepID=A0AAV9H7G0_9PEZI|nr:hypothetical protein QBC34DRAFT_67378 [Podospora aff. communis PSN243]